MAFNKFLIAPFQSGLQTDLKPWLLPEDAFEELTNAYVFRGRVKKRFGSMMTGEAATSDITKQLHSRLRIYLKDTSGTGLADGNAAGNVPDAIFKVGQMFSVGDEIFTVQAPGAPGIMLTTGGSTTHTFDTTNGAYDIQGAAGATAVYFYPAEPVMGLTMYEDGPINNHTAFAFDTQYAYKYSGNAWINDGPTGSQFHGTNSDFFWASNWRGANVSTTLLFVTNFFCTVGVPVPATDDPMWYYNGVIWAAFNPINRLIGGIYTANSTIESAKIIIPFKDRLLFLNTIEQTTVGATITNTAYPNRCRFSHNGSPLAASAFYEPNEVGATGGGYIDSTSQEEIISAMSIRDRLIVFFERSTRELVYTGNEEQPFFWQKLNTELGSEGSFSTVAFDKDILTIGSTGIHACNGVDVYRIDEKIPNKVFEIENVETGVKRIHGIRDFDSEMVYWTFPTGDFTYPDRILVFNYKNGTWAFNDDSFTCFGYFEQQSDITWAEITSTWGRLSWTWVSGVSREKHRRVIAGNQQGFVLKLDSGVASNSRSMQISQIATSGTGWMVLTIIDHTLEQGDYIEILNAQGVVIDGDGLIYKVTTTTATTVTVDTTYIGTYTGAGTASFVSLIDIKSKQWNPYIKDGSVIYLPMIDFCVDRTSDGEITVDYSTSGTSLSLINDSYNSECILGDNTLQTSAYALITLETSQDRFWHTVYFQAEGDNVQIRIYMTETQMKNPLIVFSAFELEGIILHTQKLGRQV